MSLYPSPVRRALDYLLDAYPMFDLIGCDWQIEYREHYGPWVIVHLGQRSENFETEPSWARWQFAIWKTTGALHSMKDGAVSDDPIWTP